MPINGLYTEDELREQATVLAMQYIKQFFDSGLSYPPKYIEHFINIREQFFDLLKQNQGS